ncbi:MAG TPA: DUF4118 domain-containing protein [Caulobacteraceae bacterium]|nr:DUF4118 domain-containing protein [Caulobacteraceae bacterium]
MVAPYGISLLLVGAAVVVGYAFESLITPANLTLVFVLPVVISATTFGWGPSIAAVVAGVLAFDFFFTAPRYQLTIASPVDAWAAVLLLVIAAIVSAIASQARRRALEAGRKAQQASALQVLAHLVVAGRPRREIVQGAAIALGQIFDAPAVVFEEQQGSLQLAAGAEGVKANDAEEAAARGALAMGLVARAHAYPNDEARFDYWPIRTPGGAFVLGVDFTSAEEGRPSAPDRFVEAVGAYLTAASRDAAQPT